MRHAIRACCAALMLTLTACQASPPPPPDIPVVDVVGRDFALEAPDSLPPGPTRFRFRREGTVAHEVAMARVKAGVPLDSLLRIELAGGDINGMYDPGEGLLYLDPGEVIDAELLITLEAGRDYVLICTLDKDGKTHAMLGMVRGLRVR